MDPFEISRQFGQRNAPHSLHSRKKTRQADTAMRARAHRNPVAALRKRRGGLFSTALNSERFSRARARARDRSGRFNREARREETWE